MLWSTSQSQNCNSSANRFVNKHHLECPSPTIFPLSAEAIFFHTTRVQAQLTETLPGTKYSFSFLTGALYATESLAVAAIWRKDPDWSVVSRLVGEQNALRQRTAASRTRLLRQIRNRLEQLSPEELDFLCDANPRDQRQLLFLAVCRGFRFIREFVEEVVRPKALALNHQIYPSDFARFFDRKADEDPAIEKLTEKSVAKIKEVIHRMLAEAGLLDSTANRCLTPRLPSRALARLIARTDAKQLRLLLLSDADIRQLTN